VLPDEVRAEIRASVPSEGPARAAVVDALSAVQRARGWVSDEDVADIAAEIGMSAAEVDDVATFYSLVFRRPVGRHVILVCDSVSCWLNGSDDIVEHLTSTLGISVGETTADGAFTVLPAGCLGLCERAPALLVDDVTHGPLDPSGVDALLAEKGWRGRQTAADIDLPERRERAKADG
jgi:NADH-quinone oxidoreductase subunit E